MAEPNVAPAGFLILPKGRNSDGDLNLVKAIQILSPFCFCICFLPITDRWAPSRLFAPFFSSSSMPQLRDDGYAPVEEG
jgi:hypothetical protein